MRPETRSKLEWVCDKFGAVGVTVASEEGLPVVSTARDPEHVAGWGVKEAKERLIGSGFSYLTLVEGDRVRVVSLDDKFYYIIDLKHGQTLDPELLMEVRKIVDEEEEEWRKKARIRARRRARAS